MTIQCQAKNEITDIDRLAYLDHDAEQHVVQHIESCQYCLQAVADLLAIDIMIQDVADRQDCPNMDDLVQYSSGISSNEAQIQAHLSSCDACQADIHLIQVQISEVDTQPQASPIWPMLQSFGKRILEAVERPFAQPQLAFRGGHHDEYFFEVALYQLIIQKTKQLKGNPLWQLRGQLMKAELPFTEDNILVQILNKDKVIADTHLDMFGMFEFNNLPSDTYRINIMLKTELVFIQDFTIA